MLLEREKHVNMGGKNRQGGMDGKVFHGAKEVSLI